MIGYISLLLMLWGLGFGGLGFCFSKGTKINKVDLSSSCVINCILVFQIEGTYLAPKVKSQAFSDAKKSLAIFVNICLTTVPSVDPLKAPLRCGTVSTGLLRERSPKQLALAVSA